MPLRDGEVGLESAGGEFGGELFQRCDVCFV